MNRGLITALTAIGAAQVLKIPFAFARRRPCCREAWVRTNSVRSAYRR